MIFTLCRPCLYIEWWDPHGRQITKTKRVSIFDHVWIEDFGRKVVIENVQFSDGGNYTCRGVNNNGSRRRTIWLYVTCKSRDQRIKYYRNWLDAAVSFSKKEWASYQGTNTFYLRIEGTSMYIMIYCRLVLRHPKRPWDICIVLKPNERFIILIFTKQKTFFPLLGKHDILYIYLT